MWSVVLAALLLGPSSRSVGAGTAVDAQERMEQFGAFAAVVGNHVERTLGMDRLPSARGTVIEPGVWVTLGLEGMQIYDLEAVPLRDGRVGDATPAPGCRSGCPTSFFDAFAHQWLAMTIESVTLATRVPNRVHIAADARVPVQTFFEVAYAAAETRPVLPPAVSILVHSEGRGLRAQPVHLVPPEGLELTQGSAALAFTIAFGGGTMRVSAEDATVGRDREIQPRMLPSVIKTLRKGHPGKEAVILEPEPSVTMAELVAMIAAVQGEFPRIVLGRGGGVHR